MTQDTVHTLTVRRETARAELNDFRIRARNRAIQGFRDGEWSLERLNTVLEQLGLARFEPEYDHTVPISLHLRLTVRDVGSRDAEDQTQGLNTAAVRTAIHRAVADTLHQHAPGNIGVSEHVRLHVDYPNRTLAN